MPISEFVRPSCWATRSRPALSGMSRPGHEQAERDRLGVAVRELGVGGVGEEQLPPVGGEGGRRRTSNRELLGDLLAQQAAEPGAGLGYTSRGQE